MTLHWLGQFSSRYKETSTNTQKVLKFATQHSDTHSRYTEYVFLQLPKFTAYILWRTSTLQCTLIIKLSIRYLYFLISTLLWKIFLAIYGLAHCFTVLSYWNNFKALCQPCFLIIFSIRKLHNWILLFNKIVILETNKSFEYHQDFISSRLRSRKLLKRAYVGMFVMES